jgi:DNA polymerase III subunit delta'
MFEAPHPRFTPRLYGHEAAVEEFTRAAHSGKMHHAWILGGDEGLGKATFAYLCASYLLQGQKLNGQQDFYAPPLPKIAAQAHSNLLVLERPQERTATGLYKTIPVDMVRKIHPFFGATAGEEGRRICIVDAVDDLNTAGANALLKMVEEPPRDALFFLISHQPYRLLPTLRSRARVLNFKKHRPETVEQILQSLDLQANSAVLEQAQGNLQRALEYLDPDVQQMRQLLLNTFKQQKMSEQVMKLAELIAGKDARLMRLFSDEITAYLHGLAVEMAERQEFIRAKHYDDLLHKIQTEIATTQSLNLDRKACVLVVMSWLF